MTSEVIRVFSGKGSPQTPMALIAMLKTALQTTEYANDYRSQRTKEVMDAVREGRMPILVACETAPEMERFLEATKEYTKMKIIFTLSTIQMKKLFTMTIITL